jgi:hypothetical protein
MSDGFSFFISNFCLPNAAAKFEQFEPKLHKPSGFCENLVVVSIFTRAHFYNLEFEAGETYPLFVEPGDHVNWRCNLT